MDNSEEKSPVSIEGWRLRLCQHRLLLMLVVFASWGLLTGISCVVPAKYRSETLILIEQQRVPEHYVEANVSIDLQQRLQSMTEQILSRTRLVGIVEKFHLYPQYSHGDPDGLLAAFRKDIKVELIRGDRDQVSAFKVAYNANTPAIAQQVTAELTSLFIEENLRDREELSRDTTAFLETELESARKSLDLQEQRLRDFKSRYMGQLPEQTGTNIQILSGLQNRLLSATDARNQAEQQKLYLQSLMSQYGQSRQTSGSPDNGMAIPSRRSRESDQKIALLKSELANLSAKYTPRHPDVVRLQEEIAATEKVKALADRQAASNSTDQLTDAPTTLSAGDSQSLSAFTQLQSQLKANEFEIANRKAEINKVEKDIDSYQQRLNLAPAREQELASITRDHEQSRLNYESLLAKKNQSAMATNLEKRQQGEQFRMIDPPSLPQKPYFPNRLFFSLGGLALGLALGIAILLTMEFLSPRVYGELELQAIVPTPFLITIPPMLTGLESRRKVMYRTLEAATATVLVVAVPAVTFLIYRKG
jgi:succinoglycan biosynthesis transport protein ExoP